MVQDLAIQWIQSYLCKTKTSQETEKKPSQKPQLIHTDNSLAIGKSCEELSWNHRISTPHRSETNGIAERAVRRVKEGTSAVLLQSGLDEKSCSDSMECCCYLRNVQDLLAYGKTPYERRCGESFKRTSYSIRRTSGISPKLRERDTKRESINSERKYFQNCFIGYPLIAGGIWKGDILIAVVEELEKLDASEIYPRRLNAKEVLISQKDRQFLSLVADGSAKLSGRDYEFQEPTLRRESTVRRENLSGEYHRDREEFRLEETKDDAGIHKDFWSIQGDFIYRHHVETRVQFFVPKEESFPIPLEYMDFGSSYRSSRSCARSVAIL